MNDEMQIHQVAQKVAELMNTDFELQASVCLIKKNRTFLIYADEASFTCTLELNISFNQITESGHAFNKAEILLLPEEFPAFTFTVKEHPIPLPAECRQNSKANPNLISYCIETLEPPEHFASRLSAAFKTIEPLSNHAISL
jgi:hypothetical protein